MADLSDRSDEFRRRMERATSKSPTVADCLTEDFMKRYTKFRSWPDMLAAVLTDEGVNSVENLSPEQMQAAVPRYTSFANWAAMIATAHGEWIKRQMEQ